MVDTNTMVIGALILMGGVLVLPLGDAYVKLFLIVVGTLLLAGGIFQAVRRRREPAKQKGGREPPAAKPKGHAHKTQAAMTKASDVQESL
jgi:membrane protein implicated in regulation of membrane protease activity